MKRICFPLSLLLLAGCSGAPTVRYSQLQCSSQPDTIEEGIDEAGRLRQLMESVRGAQFGDAIFKRNTAVYWIVPEVDRLELAVTGRPAGFSADEFLKRQQEVEEQHKDSFVFVIDLRMPFNSGWSKEKLIEFLEANLVITLETGSKEMAQPQRRLFHVSQHLDKNPATTGNELEVQVPVRVLFSRSEVASGAEVIVLKLRLLKPPPFRIGFFDDKFFQGFRWKIDREG